jgi:hypothetical protein
MQESDARDQAEPWDKKALMLRFIGDPLIGVKLGYLAIPDLWTHTPFINHPLSAVSWTSQV